jgi:hypothetical protein
MRNPHIFNIKHRFAESSSHLLFCKPVEAMQWRVEFNSTVHMNSDA